MRILIANDGLTDAGGVHAYLEAVSGALEARGHTVAHAYCTDSGGDQMRVAPRSREAFHVGAAPAREVDDRIRRWAPDLCFSHNMRRLAVDSALAAEMPVVKFMHGYFGTCIGGLKTHAFPAATACTRAYGAACLALYFPRRCGRMNPSAFLNEWRWAQSQRRLFESYAAMVVASSHMRDEYVRSGVDRSRLRVNPLFPTDGVDAAPSPAPGQPQVAFLGRMTSLKGGDLLIRAIAHANARLGRSVRLTMIGDGPQLAEWQALSDTLGVHAIFHGWITGAGRWPLLRDASLVALPGVWPEPFGLVGLEAGALGVPAVAVRSGGVDEWLRDGVNGVAVPGPPSAQSFGDALASLFAQPERLAAMRAHAHRVASEMSLDMHVDRLEAIFAGVRAPAGV